MRTVSLERHGKARVWPDEMPDMAYTAANVEERSVAAGPAMTLRPCAAVEMLVPRGPLPMYGALGVLFTPAAGGALIIRAGAVDAGAVPFKNALAGSIDEVRTGLLSEFVAPVLKGLMTGGEAAGLGAGVLMVTHAACGRVGSNAWLFERLGRAAVVALTAPADTDWAAALTALLK